MTEAEKEQIMRFALEEFIPFNKMLDLKFHQKEPLTVSMKKRPDLVGNTINNVLHGGVIATLIDVAGGFALLKHIFDTEPDVTQPQLIERFGRTGTVDLRIDYVRPGRGSEFFTTAEIIRQGKRFTVARMELHNEEGILIAIGTGTYVV